MPKQILLATLGRTPQIITEAVYFHKTRLNLEFDEVRVLTTTPGRLALEACLFGSTRHPGSFATLCRRLHIPYGRTVFSDRTITVLHGADGAPLDDIRTSDDSEAVADQILWTLRDLCRDRDSAIHATIAGGRKTMGVYLHSALQLIGRTEDRLFHILTHPLVEEAIAAGRMKDFFYPVRDVRFGRLVVRKSEMLDCVEIPLLRWPAAPDLDRLTYRQLVARRDQEIRYQRSPDPLTLNAADRTLLVGDHEIRLPKSLFFWYCYLAQIAGEQLPVADFMAYVKVEGDRRIAFRGNPSKAMRETLEGHIKGLLQLNATLRRGHADDFPRMLHEHCVRSTPDPAIRQVVSHTNRAIRRALGNLAEPYVIQGKRGSGGYRLTLPRELIVFKW